MRGISPFAGRLICGIAVLGAVVADQPAQAAPFPLTTFSMVSSGGPSGCLPNAKATVSINSLGPVEVMTVVANGLPANTNFDLFNIQVPKFPFGLS